MISYPVVEGDTVVGHCGLCHESHGMRQRKEMHETVTNEINKITRSTGRYVRICGSGLEAHSGRKSITAAAAEQKETKFS